MTARCCWSLPSPRCRKGSADEGRTPELGKAPPRRKRRPAKRPVSEGTQSVSIMAGRSSCVRARAGTSPLRSRRALLRWPHVPCRRFRSPRHTDRSAPACRRARAAPPRRARSPAPTQAPAFGLQPADDSSPTGCAVDQRWPRRPRRRRAGSSSTKRHQLLAQRLALRARSSASRPMKSRGLVQLHANAKPGLAGRFVGPEFGAPGAAAGLDAQRVQRVVAGVAQAQVGAGLVQRQVDMARHLHRHVQLEARAADIAHARGAHAGDGPGRSPACAQNFSASGDRSSGLTRRQQLARVRAHHRQHAAHAR